MNDLHDDLLQKNVTYADWHGHKSHRLAHFLILAMVAIAVTVGLLKYMEPKQIVDTAAEIVYHDPFAELHFEERMNGKSELYGDEAVAALGTDAATIAKEYNLTAEELKTGFKNDPTLRINPNGLLFHADIGLLPEGASLGDGTLANNPVASSIPDSQTFLLHSKPTATAKLYINFKGATVTHPVWNGGATIVAAAPALTLNQMKAIWRSVAEDYAAFNIDVTTEAGSMVDASKYMEVIVAASSEWYCGSPTPCVGGVAYVGSFTWGDATPAWVFSGPLTNDTKLVAEAVSHESGHTLGLSHSSQYDTACNFVTTYYGGSGTVFPGWAPIMGNSYNKAVTQWLNSAENSIVATPYGCTSEQDQIAIIASQNGFGFASDETGATTTNAQQLPIASNTGGVNTVDTLGVMTQGDTDIYKIVSTGGDITFTVKPMTPAATMIIGNADFAVQLLDSNQIVLSESNPSAVAVATVSKLAATAGTYYLKITPSANGDFATAGGYTASSSMGSYQVTGSYGGTLPINDTTVPTATLTAPLAGATLVGLATLSATASDNTGVTSVVFYRGSTVIGTDTTAPYSLSWDSKTVANGTYLFTAAAYDAAGNTASSTSVSANVNNTIVDTTAPAVSFTAPASGATVSGTVTLSANASDTTGVSKVSFYRGTVLIAEDTTAPYSVNWNTAGLTAGTYTLYAKAVDPAGNLGTATTTAVIATVADNTSPVVKISKPKNNATVTRNVAISASATDNIGVIKLELYIDGAFIAQSSSTSLNYTWATPTTGTHTILVKAYDKIGNVGQSSVSVKK